MKHDVGDNRRAERDTRGLGFRDRNRRQYRLLWCNGCLRGWRNADPAVLDAEPRRVAILDVLLRALYRRHENQRDGKNRDTGTNRSPNGERRRVGHDVRKDVLYSPHGARRKATTPRASYGSFRQTSFRIAGGGTGEPSASES